MSDIALRTVGLGKLYHIGSERDQYGTLRDTMVQAAKRPLERIRHPGAVTRASKELWALRGVDMEVTQGEVLGVIGRNGSGKSTLLKVLSHITEPTEGVADVRGRVASLLEVGTGFHPELTGRENIQLNGAILGMTRAEIKRKFDEIVEFSEIGRFLDTPVKRYSSGMYVRLAFAVAAHLEPEILVIDEVLSVGDAEFQKKCLGRMGDVAHDGRTVLFVSHNMVAVAGLCSRTIVLDQGWVTADGDPKTTIAGYLQTAASSMTHRDWVDAQPAPQSDSVRILHAHVSRPGAGGVAHLTILDPLEIVFRYRTRLDGLRLNLSVTLSNGEGVAVFNTTSIREPHWHGYEFPPGDYESAFEIPARLLNDDTYRVQVLFVRDESTIVLNAEDILTFEVHDAEETRSSWHGKWAGVVRPELTWRTERLSNEG